MCSRWSQLEEVDQRLSIKVCKIVSQVRPEAIQQSGSSAKALRQNKGIAAGGPGLRAGSGSEISARERLKPKRAGTKTRMNKKKREGGSMPGFARCFLFLEKSREAKSDRS